MRTFGGAAHVSVRGLEGLGMGGFFRHGNKLVRGLYEDVCGTVHTITPSTTSPRGWVESWLLAILKIIVTALRDDDEFEVFLHNVLMYCQLSLMVSLTMAVPNSRRSGGVSLPALGSLHCK